jgi:hypothetical protein
MSMVSLWDASIFIYAHLFDHSKKTLLYCIFACQFSLEYARELCIFVLSRRKKWSLKLFITSMHVSNAMSFIF